jgi:phosphoglycerate kinase
MEAKMTPLRGMDVSGKRILFRPDINSPIDPVTKKIVNDNRLRKNAPTLKYMLEGGAAVAIIAHQGDTLDYQNLIPLAEHAEKLSKLVGRTVRYIDDVCGPAAVAAAKSLNPGEALLLGNLRYLGEELSTFEKDVKLKPQEMLQTYLVRSLAPLFDLYVNDAFAAAHRNAPSMVAFEELLPSAAGFQFYDEYTALKALRDHPRHPAVFVLGGAKISDAFDMMGTALKNGMADRILTTGLTAIVMLLAKGVDVGQKTVDFLSEKDLLVFLEPARKHLELYGDKIEVPVDFAIEETGLRKEIDVSAMPLETLYLDIGARTSQKYALLLKSADMIFANGPAGVYEDDRFSDGTKGVWQAIADSDGYSVIGGGDTVSSASKFIDLNQIDYVCTAGGAMVRFMSGKKLPLIDAMEKAFTVYSDKSDRAD